MGTMWMSKVCEELSPPLTGYNILMNWLHLPSKPALCLTQAVQWSWPWWQGCRLASPEGMSIGELTVNTVCMEWHRHRHDAHLFDPFSTSVVKKAVHRVLKSGQLYIPLLGCSTWESKLWISPEKHNRAVSNEVSTGEASQCGENESMGDLAPPLFCCDAFLPLPLY